MEDNKEFQILLSKSGWSPERKVDGKLLKSLIEQAGYEVLPKVMSFLISFDGISIKFINLRNGIEDDINISFEKGNNLEGKERIFEDYYPRIGRRLCVVGTASRDHFVLVMDEDGKLYGGYSSFLVKFGDTATEGIEAIVFNLDIMEIK